MKVFHVHFRKEIGSRCVTFQRYMTATCREDLNDILKLLGIEPFKVVLKGECIPLTASFPTLKEWAESLGKLP